MNFKLLFICLFLSLRSVAQISDNLYVSPKIDRNLKHNQAILLSLDSFLMKKDTSSYQELFKYWKKEDFERFRTPYYYLKGVEKNGAGEVMYKPSVMEILPIDNSQYIVKLSYISTQKSNLFVKAICNLVADYSEEDVLFSSYLNIIDDKWKKINVDEIDFFISPNRHSFDGKDIQKQMDFNRSLCEFFDVEKVPYTYFSASSVEEFFNIQGVQYHPMMYADSTGGLVLHDVIISANDSEFYPHEVCHLYIKKRIPNIDNYFDEGMATYFGGSGKLMYEDYLQKIKTNLDGYDFMKIFKQDIFDNSLWEPDMPINYVVSAIVCDYGINMIGKEKFFERLNSTRDRFKILSELGIREGDFNKTIAEYLRRK
ncbi:hypothetical protein [Sphingobacterium sp. xlx-130]|uniref:hypothetical protein n=1 Tax=Sphingobacterium sp. xlx-130 TaxID=2654323 RepID=UPI0013DB2E89|nr:hypothetical protein [Sphingobacterium sp. xlx-130]